MNPALHPEIMGVSVACSAIYILVFVRYNLAYDIKRNKRDFYVICLLYGILFAIQAIGQVANFITWQYFQEPIKEGRYNFEGFAWLMASVPQNLIYFIFLDAFTIRIWSCSEFMQM